MDQAALEYFFNSVGKLFAVLDSTGRVKRANLAFRRFVGPASGAADASIFSYLSDRSKENFQDTLSKLKPLDCADALALMFRVGRDDHSVVADLTRAENGDIYLSAQDVTQESLQERRTQEAFTNLTRLEDVVGIGHWRILRNRKSDWSPGMFRLYGIDPEDGPPDYITLRGMMSPEDVRTMERSTQACYDSGEPVSLSYMITTPAGEQRILDVAGSPSVDSDGKVIGIHGISVDKTDAVKALKAVMETDSTVQHFLQHAPVATAVFDMDMRTLLVSRKWCEDFNTTEDVVLGRPLTSFWPADSGEIVLTAFEDAMNGERTDHDRYNFKLGGLDLWLRWTAAPWYDSEGAIGGVIFSHQDITRLEMTRQAMEASHERMSYGIELANMLVWETDFETQTHHTEGDWRQFHSKAPSYEFFTKGFFEVIHPADYDGVIEKWERHVRSGAPFNVQHRMENAAGREIWVSSTVKLVRNAKGKPIRMIGALKDITSMKRSELRIREAERETKTANAAKSEFIARIGHELRAPLEGLAAVTSTLQRTDLPDAQQKLVDLIGSSGQVMSDMLNDILEFAKLDAGQVECDIAPFVVRDALKMALADNAEEGDRRQVKASLNISPDAEGIYRGDGARIRKVASYLLREAMQTNSDATVRLHADVEDSGEGIALLTLEMRDNGQQEREDGGQGYERVLSSDMGQPLSGAGMALALATKLVQLMNGSIKVEKVSDGGRIVTVEIPVTQDKPVSLSRTQADASDDGPGIGGRSILVAEDNSMNRRILELILAAFEMKPTFVENGEEAVNAVKAEDFDVVLMDMVMPIMDGFKATQAIRDWESDMPSDRQRLVIIGASAHATAESRQRGRDAGLDAHVDKPIVQEDLLTLLNDLVSHRPRIQTKAA